MWQAGNVVGELVNCPETGAAKPFRLKGVGRSGKPKGLLWKRNLAARQREGCRADGPKLQPRKQARYPLPPRLSTANPSSSLDAAVELIRRRRALWAALQ